jgi:hypothetical protein
MNPKPGWIFALLPRFDKTAWRRGRRPVILAPRTAAEGADLGHFCWHLDALLPSVALERMTIEHLMPVQAAAAAGVRQ